MSTLLYNRGTTLSTVLRLADLGEIRVVRAPWCLYQE